MRRSCSREGAVRAEAIAPRPPIAAPPAAAADTAPPAESRNFLRVSVRSMRAGTAW